MGIAAQGDAVQRASLRRLVRDTLVIVGQAGLIVLRRPEALLSPGFFADDGPTYTHALAGGSLFAPYGGYLIVPQRIVMGLATLFSPAAAPLFNNLVAIALATSVAGLLVVRPRQPWLALAFVLLPGSWWVLGTMVDIQWVLGIYVLIVVAAPRPWDAIPLALVALQGPIALLLTPLFAVRWWFRRDNGMVTAVLAIASIPQVLVILGHPRTVSPERSQWLLDIAWRGFVVPVTGFTLSPLVWPIIAIPIAGLLFLTARRLGWWGAALGYVWVVFTLFGTVLSPYASTTIVGPELSLTERFFYLVGAAVVGAIVLGATRRIRAALVLAPLVVVAMVADFRLPTAPSTGTWARDSACIGGPSPCTVPIGSGPGWDVYWTPR